ncbi:MAG: lasso peptide biosynthesis B2 protein [Gemmatimonadaceae bacterium]
MLILVLKAALKILGFEKTLRWMRTRVGRAELLGGVDSATVTATEHAVAVAGALYPGRALCLEQSLVLYYVLRRQGVAIKYCTGIQPHPFAAHAWAEYCGQVVNDVAEHVRHFTRLPDQLP